MLVKLITCEVPDENLERFAAGQAAWSALAKVDGFLGQLGGWELSDWNRAVIVGLWRDAEAYNRFMSDAHDAIFESHGQQDSYTSSDISLWQSVLGIPGSLHALGQAVEQAGLIRIALCRLRPGRREHFVEVQRNTWNPGMAASGGLLCGVFSRHCDDEDRFAVCTLWSSEAEHRRYRETIFHELRRAARVEDDCSAVAGMLVGCEASWKVAAAQA